MQFQNNSCFLLLLVVKIYLNIVVLSVYVCENMIVNMFVNTLYKHVHNVNVYIDMDENTCVYFGPLPKYVLENKTSETDLHAHLF